MVRRRRLAADGRCAARARHQPPNANAEALPYPRPRFDAVFSNAALHWVRDQDAMMAEVHRVLKPGGRFVAEMGGHGNIAAIRVAFMAVLARHGYADREDGVNYYPTPEAYTRRLERHGFHVWSASRSFPVPRRWPNGGMDGWLRTFRRGVLDGLPEPVRETVVAETVRCSLPPCATRKGTGPPITCAFASSPALESRRRSCFNNPAFTRKLRYKSTDLVRK